MRNLIENLGVKITAILLSFLSVCVAAACVWGTLYMARKNYFTASKEELVQTAFENRAHSKVVDVYYYYLHNGLDIYGEDDLYYTVTDENGEVLASNYHNEPYFVSSFDYFTRDKQNTYENEDGKMITETEKEKLQVFIYIPEKTRDDMRTEKMIGILYDHRYTVIAVGCVAALSAVVCLIYLFCAVSHRRGGVIALNHLDRIPFDLLAAVCFVVLVPVLNFGIHGRFEEVDLLILVPVAYSAVLAFSLTFAARIKNQTLLRGTVIYRLCHWGGKGVRGAGRLFRKLPLVKKTLAVLAAVTAGGIFVVLIALFAAMEFGLPGLSVLLCLMFLVSLYALVLRVAIILQNIRFGGERIAQGDLEYKIDTTGMFGDFKEFAESLNHIGGGLQNAVNERMKSERFKTELITNVSHDIKTPLTSIINYVDLLKKEEPENEKTRQYLDVLDRQSKRLKKLTEDLVEASKASTGSLPVDFAPCEVGILLSQTVGEFDEKLRAAGLIPVLKLPEKPVTILADGRHLWRVFDNLMNNICKYSQNGTRVYLEVKRDGGKAVITFKNISRYELNVSSEELMERFVRGDRSRNTEGSGLGLSIARSLTELQNGKMELEIDGDLFKVNLIFDSKDV